MFKEDMFIKVLWFCFFPNTDHHSSLFCPTFTWRWGTLQVMSSRRKLLLKKLITVTFLLFMQIHTKLSIVQTGY